MSQIKLPLPIVDTIFLHELKPTMWVFTDTAYQTHCQPISKSYEGVLTEIIKGTGKNRTSNSQPICCGKFDKFKMLSVNDLLKKPRLLQLQLWTMPSKEFLPYRFLHSIDLINEVRSIDRIQIAEMPSNFSLVRKYQHSITE